MEPSGIAPVLYPGAGKVPSSLLRTDVLSFGVRWSATPIPPAPLPAFANGGARLRRDAGWRCSGRSLPRRFPGSGHAWRRGRPLSHCLAPGSEGQSASCRASDRSWPRVPRSRPGSRSSTRCSWGVVSRARAQSRSREWVQVAPPLLPCGRSRERRMSAPSPRGSTCRGASIRSKQSPAASTSNGSPCSSRTGSGRRSRWPARCSRRARWTSWCWTWGRHARDGR